MVRCPELGIKRVLTDSELLTCIGHFLQVFGQKLPVASL